MTRFSEFQKSLNIAPNVLSTRLDTFVAEGLMTTSKGDSEHLEYLLSAKGLDFKPVIIALCKWGDRWAAPEGPPIEFEHDGCGGRVEQFLHCQSCRKPIKSKDSLAKATQAMSIYQARRAKAFKPIGKKVK